VTPCRFLGYRFDNGDVIYEVSEDGLLRVTQGGKVLLQEQGEWQL
jgi:MOSC domain-containing protein YiiM